MPDSPDERPLPQTGDEGRLSEVTLVQASAGPLPPPEVLRAYREAVPDAPERIMDMAEAQARHRMQMDRLGLVAAVVVAALAIVPSVLLAVTDRGWPISLAGLVPVAAIAAVFVRSALRSG